MGGMHTFATAVEMLQTSYRKMNPFCIPFAISNMGECTTLYRTVPHCTRTELHCTEPLLHPLCHLKHGWAPLG